MATKSKSRALAEKIGLPEGYTAKWANDSRPTGKWKSFNKGSLPSLLVFDPAGEEHYIANLAGEVHYGSNQHAGGDVHIYIVRHGQANGRLKASRPTVDEAKALAEEWFSSERGQLHVKGLLKINVEDQAR